MDPVGDSTSPAGVDLMEIRSCARNCDTRMARDCSSGGSLSGECVEPEVSIRDTRLAVCHSWQ